MGELSEYEKQIILLYFANSYEMNQKKEVIRILIVCPNGIGASHILKERLMKEIPEIQSITIIDIDRLIHTDTAMYDVILSTMKLPHFKHEYLVVSPLLLDDELKKVKERIALKDCQIMEKEDTSWQFGQLEQTTNLIQWVYQLVNQCSLYSLSQKNSIEEYVSNIIDTIKFQVLEADTCKKSLTERIHVAPIGIPDSHIALLHAKTSGVTREIVHFFELNNTVTMEAMNHEMIEVKRFLLMIAPENITNDKQELLGSISTSLVMNDDHLRLFESGNIQSIKDVLSNTLMKQLMTHEER